MAFIAIDAKADIENSKKGKLTPAQHAQLNAWCLSNKTGILDWGDKCAPTLSSYSVSGNTARVYFKKGFVVICGRLVECEADSYVDVTAPTVGSEEGKIILRFDLSSAGATEFQALATTEALVQTDLNDNVYGRYDFELCRYTAYPNRVEVRRVFYTNYIKDISRELLTIDRELSEFNGRINDINSSINQRLVPLEVSSSAETSNFADLSVKFTIFKIGKLVFANVVSAFGITSATLHYFASGSTLFTIPTGYRPKENALICILIENDNCITERKLICGIWTTGECKVANSYGSGGTGIKYVRFTMIYRTE